jgi:predicted DCC family thiol-disulfide oxidoreductase YuxK
LQLVTGSDVILFYDGTCGFCANSVQFVLAHEARRRTLRFASLQGDVGLDLHQRHPELQGVDSLIWYEPAAGARAERILIRSDAVIATARYLGGIWRVLGSVARVVPRRLRDWTYDLVARHRYQIAGRADACLLPTPEQRSRFLDFPFAVADGA